MTATVPAESYAAVIVHYRNPEALQDLLSSLAVQSFPPRRVIVVDNSSAESELKVLNPGLDIQIIPSASNGGYASAVNLARSTVLRMRVPLVAVLTQDVLLRPDTMAVLMARAEEGWACLGPVLYRRSQPNSVFSYGGYLGFGGRALHRRSAPLSESAYVVDWMDGAVLLLAVDKLEQVDWFDERYFLYYEEVDLCTRLRARYGDCLVIEPRAIAYQEPGNYTPYLQLRNHILFWRKNMGGPSIVPSILYEFLRASARAVINLSPANIVFGVKGIFAGIAGRGGPPSPSL